MKLKSLIVLTAAGAVLVGAVVVARAAAEPDAKKPADPAVQALDDQHGKQAEKLIDTGVAYLMSKREPDGGWSMGRGANKPAITGMVLKVLIRHRGHGPNSPVVKKGFESLLKFRQRDGGIYEPRIGLANYTTAIAVMAMAAGGQPQHKPIISDAVKFLRGQQILAGAESPDGRKITKDHPFFGGVSYGQHGRPDMSNVGMWMQALKDAGVPGDDPAMRNALIFVARNQNRSESNKMAWAAAGSNDGGFVYAPATGDNLKMGESKAGAGFGGRGLRSYGSMTYVGFKSLLYAGLTRKDPRVLAAFKWIQRYWRLDSNPNMPRLQSKQGLFYYYHAFAKALRAWGKGVITDTKGVEHNWRHELIEALAACADKDGSWVNEGAERWNEGNPILVTAYAVLTLQETLE